MTLANVHSNRCHRRGGTKPGFQDLMTNNSGLLPDELSGGKDGEVWDAAYRESRGELLVLIGVDFHHNGLTRHVLCGARDFWRSCATRTAPVSPEINQDRNARVLDDLVEQCRVDLDGFIEWRQRRFACTATAGVRQVSGGGAIFLATGFAGSNHRHLL